MTIPNIDDLANDSIQPGSTADMKRVTAGIANVGAAVRSLVGLIESRAYADEHGRLLDDSEAFKIVQRIVAVRET